MSNLFLARWAKLYSDPTPAERALEPAVASLGVPYRFQHPLWALHVFPDFALIRDKVIIEVDDPGHRKRVNKKKDAERTAKLARAGWRVVRCTNEQAETAPYDTVDRLMADAGLPYRAHHAEHERQAA